ncbi:hypothetical protein KDH_23950 [Dictyobacter sp. S3.2.2.5]|uniref:Uncharacterized protein n=1 Tax=Dictyobacter halimunensis TaxID=3026934 RepID=A0ABQ6FRZ3_9CHLR|nr:hypothetical protein KDH_23950 [Dictyobacter sp. S3.2.2.5]
MNFSLAVSGYKLHKKLRGGDYWLQKAREFVLENSIRPERGFFRDQMSLSGRTTLSCSAKAGP